VNLIRETSKLIGPDP